MLAGHVVWRKAVTAETHRRIHFGACEQTVAKGGYRHRHLLTRVANAFRWHGDGQQARHSRLPLCLARARNAKHSCGIVAIVSAAIIKG